MSLIYQTGLPASMDRKNREWEAKPTWLKVLYVAVGWGGLIIIVFLLCLIGN